METVRSVSQLIMAKVDLFPDIWLMNMHVLIHLKSRNSFGSSTNIKLFGSRSYRSKCP